MKSVSIFGKCKKSSCSLAHNPSYTIGGGVHSPGLKVSEFDYSPRSSAEIKY